MHVVLGIILVVLVATYLYRNVTVARAGAWTGPRTKGMRTRAASRSAAPGRRSRATSRGGSLGLSAGRPARSVRLLRAETAAATVLLWEKAKSANWLEDRRAERKRAAQEEAQARRGAPAGAPPVHVVTTVTTGPAPASPETAPASPQEPPQPPAAEPPPASPGGPMTAAGTSTAGAEQALEGISMLVARAASGNVFAKRECILAMYEVAERMSSALGGLARAMAEPGMNYGPEITEPLALAAMHQQASAMSLAESDAALTALLNRSVGEQAASGRQTPHHQNELAESGAR
jgi:hypothetical protein